MREPNPNQECKREWICGWFQGSEVNVIRRVEFLALRENIFDVGKSVAHFTKV
jgi:hypothetical protein